MTQTPGRSIASNGYVLIRVGKHHHLADVRGYAYEHRLIAERKYGRRLVDGELVHHKNENKQDNHPDNLEIVNGNAEHFALHRTRADLRVPGEPNPMVLCECGCGTSFLKFDDSNRPRSFVSGHNAGGDGLIHKIRSYISANGFAQARELAAAFGKTRPQITAALSQGRADGHVCRRGRIWVLPAETEVLP